MKKKILIFLVGIMLLIPVLVNAAFSDLASNHWAYNFISDLTSQGVINGYPDGTFIPENTLTKGAFMKLIMTASLPHLDFAYAPADFNHWASAYVSVAENYGILEEGEMNPENIDLPINRIDVIRILSLCDINIRENPQQSVTDLSFNDISALSVSEKILLEHAVASNIISGYPDGSFKPNNNLTRAEASKILHIYMGK